MKTPNACFKPVSWPGLQDTQVVKFDVGTRKLRPHSNAMSARDWDIMQGNVPLDKNGTATAQARRIGETQTQFEASALIW